MRYNILVSRILLVLTAITFALASPVLVQEKRQAHVHEAYVPKDVTNVLGKRISAEDFNVLWDVWWHHLNVLGESPPPPQAPLRKLASSVHVPEAHVPPPVSEDFNRGPMEVGVDTRPKTPPSGIESSAESDSDSGRWSTISNAPSAKSQSEDLKAAESALIELKGKAKVLPSDSGASSSVDTVDAAQVEMRSVVDLRP